VRAGIRRQQTDSRTHPGHDHYGKSHRVLEAGQKDKAMQELQTALEPLAQAQDDRRTVIMGGIAGLYAEQRNYEKAIEWYNKLREEFPNTNVAAQAEQAIRMVKAEQEAAPPAPRRPPRPLYPFSRRPPAPLRFPLLPPAAGARAGGPELKERLVSRQSTREGKGKRLRASPT
jgi:tetratricopeptide (TPR) repeat protein